ncbi:MAG: efflux RND transporter periplasmic adaptor subunit, partial [Bacteroidota bacterium]
MTSTSTFRLPLVALSVLFLVAGCSTDEPDTQEETPLTQVEVIAVGEEPAVVPVQTSGQLASETEARLSFKIPGIVQRVLIDEGQQVRRGQLLAQLDPVEIQAQVRQAKSGLDKATRDAERARNLYEDKVATLAQVQDAETAQEVAQAAFDAATFNARHARIYAPTSGRVLQRFAEEGELVNAGTPVLTFGETGGAWAVRAGLSDRDVVRLQVGDSARVHFDAYPGGPFSARVTEIAGAPD